MKLNKSASDAHAMIREACKEHAMPRARVSEWNKKFIDGRDGVADEDRSGRPSTSRTDKNVEKVRLLLNTDRRFIPQLIAEDLNLSKTSVYGIVTEELNMQKVCAKLVPKAPSHTSFVASEVLARNKIVTMPRPPYSPDLTPSDFFFVPTYEKGHEREPLRHRWRGPGSSDASFEEHPRVRVLRRLRSLEKPVAAMHQRRRVLFWRILGHCTQTINKTFSEIGPYTFGTHPVLTALATHKNLKLNKNIRRCVHFHARLFATAFSSLFHRKPSRSWRCLDHQKVASRLAPPQPPPLSSPFSSTLCRLLRVGWNRVRLFVTVVMWLSTAASKICF